MLIYLFFFGTVTANLENGGGVKYNPTGDSSGLIFAPIADTQLTYKEWRIVFYYDLEPYFRELELLKQYEKRLIAICTKKTENPSREEICQVTLEHVNNHMRSVSEDMEIVQSYDSIGKNRNRRGLINAVGSLQNILFGVLDQEDAKRYEEQINELKQNQDYGAQLLKENTILSERIIKTNNATFEKIEKRFENLDYELRVFDQVKDEIRVNNLFTTMAATLAIIFIDHDSLNKEVSKILSHTLKGEITDIIPANQLLKSLRTIERELNKNEELTINLDYESAYHLFRAASLHSTLRGKLIMMELRVPILRTETYKLYKTIPIPTKFNNKYTIISPTSNMFLTNQDYNKYIPITESELSDCRILNSGKYICKQNEPIFNNKDDICELMLLSKPFSNKIPNTCKTVELPVQNYYIPLEQINKFYYVIDHPIQIRTVCPNSTEVLRIDKSGILELSEDCYMDGDKFTVIAHSIKNYRAGNIILPKINLPELLHSKDEQNMEKEPLETFIKDSYSEFNELGTDVQKLKEREEIFQYRIQQEKRFGTVKGSMISQVILIAIIYLIVMIVLIMGYRSFFIELIIRICSRDKPDIKIDQETHETTIEMETMGESNESYERENTSYYTTLRGGN